MSNVSRFLCVVGWALITSTVMGQTQQTDNTWVGGPKFKRPECKVDSLQWLTGIWFGEGLGGECEELWGKPRAGTMLGAFRMYENGKTVFTEHFVLVEQDATLVLKLKHFDAELRGWEEKDEKTEFPLVQVLEREVRFDGLTYRLVTDDEMHVFVAMKGKDGKVGEGKFVFRRDTGSGK